MTRIGAALTLALGLGVLAFADDRNVVVPADTEPFTVKKADVVRIIAKGLAGAKIEAKVQGPAKIAHTNTVRELRKGKAMIGGHTKEFDLTMTDTGDVTVTIEITPPQPTAASKTTVYKFTVN